MQRVTIFRWMEVYPEKMDGKPIKRVAHDVMCIVHFSGYASIRQKIVSVITYH